MHCDNLPMREGKRMHIVKHLLLGEFEHFLLKEILGVVKKGLLRLVNFVLAPIGALFIEPVIEMTENICKVLTFVALIGVAAVCFYWMRRSPTVLAG
jgi:hypothetical protein